MDDDEDGFRTSSLLSSTEIGITQVRVNDNNSIEATVKIEKINDEIVTPAVGMFDCKKCDLKYKYYTSWLNHMEREHDGQLNNDPESDVEQDYDDENSRRTSKRRRRPQTPRMTVKKKKTDKESSTSTSETEDGSSSDWEPFLDDEDDEDYQEVDKKSKKKTGFCKRRGRPPKVKKVIYGDDDEVPSKSVKNRASTKRSIPNRIKQLSKPSVVWTHFNSTDNSLKKECIHCRKLLTFDPESGSTGHLWKHLYAEHDIVNPNAKEGTHEKKLTKKATNVNNVTKRRSTFSQVWQHFEKSEDRSKAICKHCSKVMKYTEKSGTTAHFWYHLWTEHQILNPKSDGPKKSWLSKIKFPSESENDSEDATSVENDNEDSNSQTMVKRGKTSSIWKYFEEVDPSQIRCNECQETLYRNPGYASTTHMWRHLYRQHGISKDGIDTKASKVEKGKRGKYSLVWKYFKQDKENSDATCTSCSDFKTACFGKVTKEMMEHVIQVHEEDINQTTEKSSDITEKGPTNDSLAWRYFVIDWSQPSNGDYALCQKCDIRVSCKTTNSTMLSHICNHHGTDTPKDYPIQKEGLPLLTPQDLVERKEKQLEKKVCRESKRQEQDKRVDDEDETDFESWERKQQPKKTKARKFSLVWKYFRKFSDDQAKCNVCPSRVLFVFRKKSSTKELLQHILEVHGEDNKSYRAAKRREMSDLYPRTKRQPRPKTLSIVWRYFKIDPDDERFSVCQSSKCHSFRTSNTQSTVKMLAHIRDDHTNDDEHDYPIKLPGKPNVTPKKLKDREESRLHHEHQALSEIKNGRHKNSFVWNYFVKIGDNEVRCQECETTMKFGTSFFLNSKMIRHLKSAHGIQNTEKYREDEIDRFKSCRRQRKSIAWEYFKEIRPGMLRCHKCLDYEVKIDVSRSTSHLLHHIRLNHSQDLDVKDMKAKKKRSIVWRYFRSESKEVVICLRCNNRVDRTRGSTSNMLYHIQTKHFMDTEEDYPIKDDEIEEEDDLVDDSVDIPKVSRNKKSAPKIVLADKCHLCNEHFEDDAVLVDHLRSEHFEKPRGIVKEKKMPKPPSKTLGKKRLECDICFHGFEQDWLLAKHRLEKHQEKTILEDIEVLPEMPPGFLEQDQPKLPSKIPCEHCGFMVSHSGLDYHVLSVHKPEDRPYGCDQCDLRFVFPNRLLWHRREDHRKDLTLFVCDHCGKTYNCIKKFRRHVKDNHEDPTSECKVCGQVVKKGKAMKSHMSKVHDGFMRFQCKFCGRKFWRNDNMTSHINKTHADGVYHPDLFAKNDQIDWRNYGQNNRDRVPRGTGAKAMKKKMMEAGHEISPAKKTTRKTAKEQSSTQEEAEAALRIEEVCDDSNSTIYQTNSEVIDFSEMHETVPLQTVFLQQHHHQNEQPYHSYQTPAILQYQMPSSSSRSHSHNTRFSSQQSHHSLTSCQYNPSHGISSSSDQQHMLNQLHSSAAVIAAAQSQLYMNLQPIVISGNCRLCKTNFNDIKSHYIDYHRFPLEAAMEFLNMQ